MLRLAAAQNVWSQHLLERIQCEWFGLECPSFADEFVGSKAVEGFSGEVVPCRAPRRQGALPCKTWPHRILQITRRECPTKHWSNFLWALRDGGHSSRVKIAHRGLASRQSASLVPIKRSKF